MRIWHKLQYIFFHWDTLVPRWVRYAIIALVYGAVGYSLFEYFKGSEIGDRSPLVDLRSGWQWRISIAVLLVAVNWYAEMLKWRRLVFSAVSFSRKRAMRAVLYGTSLALISPNRVGDFSGRSLFLPADKRREGASATIVSSICQNIPTFLCGAMACAALYLQHILLRYDALLLGGAVAGLGGALLFGLLLFRTSQVANGCQSLHFTAGERYFNALAQRFPKFTLYKCLGLSFLRYSVFIIQFWLIACVISDIRLQNAFMAMSAAYLANAIIPSNLLVELGIRVGIPVFILAQYGAEPTNIAMASGVLWIVNLAIPSLIGALLYPRNNE